MVNDGNGVISMSWKKSGKSDVGDGEVPAYAFYFHMHELNQVKDAAFINGDQLKAFRTMRCMFENCIYRFRKKGSEREENQEENLIKEFDKGKILFNQAMSSKVKSKVYFSWEDFEEQNHKINIILMELLAIWGILIPEEVEDLIGIIKARNQAVAVKDEGVYFEK